MEQGHWFMSNYANDWCIFLQCPLNVRLGKGCAQYVSLRCSRKEVHQITINRWNRIG